ncbi:MAG TPA: exonuclease domain-containing protein [Tepidisphaeraceae bacterium]|jgi:DNA polymerase-3 subunit epsilon|nr:exonuclease domain-containing protein [Tepidisphaeraceae bacterium]
MPISLIQPLHQTPVAFVDVETTGASAELGDRVIEIGIVRMEAGQTVAEMQELIDPQRRIGAGVVALTGISQDMVTGRPTFTDFADRIATLMDGAAIVGHNVRFDLSFLLREFRRSQIDLPQRIGPTTPVFDTVRIARRRFGRGGNGLQRLAARLGLGPAVAHRALADAQTTAGVFQRLMEPVGGWTACVCDVMREQGGPMGLLPVSPRESLLPYELEEALDLRRPVIMEYLDARGARTERVIEPLQVRRFKGELTLVAFCRMRQANRTFKLDRIVQLKRVDETTDAAGLPGPC